jgi:hypothetical protein
MALFPSPRIRLHEVFERAKTQTTTLKVYENGVVVVPTSANFTLLDNNNTKIITSAAASISVGGEISYIVAAADIPETIQFSDNYLIEWDVTFGGIEYNFRRTCAIARTKLYPVVSDIDLTAQYSDLESIRPSNMTSFQSYITEAFVQIIERLRSEGNLEYLIISNQSLRGIHIDLSLTIIFRDMDSSGLGEGRYLQLAQEHRKSYEAGFARLKFKYDLLENNTNNDADGLRAAKSVIFTSQSPTGFNRRRGRRY